MAKLYDFGADASGVSANERKAIAWPIAVWSCYIPESDVQGLNIIEHLILQLVDKGYPNVADILCRQVGFNRDLVQAALDACIDKDYFDRRFKEYRLSVEGEKILGKFDNPYSQDLEASKRNKKIYMIQDLVTKSVVPVFDIDKLPEFYIEESNVLEIKSASFVKKKPKSASIRTALRYWSRLCNNTRHGINMGSNSVNLSNPPKQVEEVEDYIPFEDEVDWEDVLNTDDRKEYEVLKIDVDTEGETSLADKEEEERQTKMKNEVKNITILDDSPEFYLARGFIAINRNAPDEAIVISPFGRRMDDWFRTVINRLRTCDGAFEDEIQIFLMEKQEELKNVIAFHNDLQIELFNRFPYISNNAKYTDLKRAIRALVITKERIVAGEDETHNYTENRATALQIALRHLFDSHKEMFQQKLSYGDYELAIKGLVNSNGFRENILHNYLSSDKSIYNHAKGCKDGTGHITGYSALLLIDAWNHKDGKSMDLLKAMPEFPDIIYKITRPRNTSTHGNKGKNGKAGYAEMYVSKEEAIKGYKEFEDVLTALYTRFMEGK